MFLANVLWFESPASCMYARKDAWGNRVDLGTQILSHFMFIYICDAPAATLLEDQYGWVAVVWCVHAVGAEPMPGNPSDTAGHIEVRA